MASWVRTLTVAAQGEAQGEHCWPAVGFHFIMHKLSSTTAAAVWALTVQRGSSAESARERDGRAPETAERESSRRVGQRQRQRGGGAG